MLALIDGTHAVLRYHDRPAADAARKAVGRMREWLRIIKARYAIVALDYEGPKVREQVWSPYKYGRTGNHADHHAAIRDALHADGLYWMQVRGEEADDLIASLVTASKGPVAVLSGDTDLLPLSSERVTVWTYGHGDYIPRSFSDYCAKLGIAPENFTAYRALVGDKDEVPGVPGIGAKTAARLLNRYGALGDLLAVGQLPEEHVDLALLSYDLAQLRTDVALPAFTVEEIRVR